jgi:hypothetical protein
MTALGSSKYHPAPAGFVNVNGTFRTNGAGQMVPATGQSADLGNGMSWNPSHLP